MLTVLDDVSTDLRVSGETAFLVHEPVERSKSYSTALLAGVKTLRVIGVVPYWRMSTRCAPLESRKILVVS